MAAIKNRLLKNLLFILTLTLITIGCEKEEVAPEYGNVSFSFAQITSANARKADTPTPAFASYTLKKSDQSTSSNKIELYAFGDDFLTQLQQLANGIYSLEAFQILDANNNVIYASPVAGSPLAGLVEHPLPLSFTIATNQTTTLVPEVLATANHNPVEKFDFAVTTTIAENNPPDEVAYTLEIIAKDAPLGNVEWTTSLPMSALGTIHIPAKHNHYTFKAIKNGYIPHIQHFLKAEVAQYTHLNFEFIPESLDGFIKFGTDETTVRIYRPNDENRCKIYARLDFPEGKEPFFIYADLTASDPYGFNVAYSKYAESSQEDGYPNRVNLFGNRPFATAQDYCAEFDLTVTKYVKAPEHALISSFMFWDAADGYSATYHLFEPLSAPLSDDE